MIHRKNMNGLFFNANVTAVKRFFLPALFHTEWIEEVFSKFPFLNSLIAVQSFFLGSATASQ